ncbi:site-specific integrase [Phocaeicola coprocola]|uniref:site-specific integrase n=1 Tax=Phocaeicola coprocola TaxID=310298 RepID=UPI001C38F788|nr:site-specific integrase [Phocaeicola coprocola]MBV3866244.1 site-specific integrase [Phocaeicola coprocola]MBV4007468.1 site-specific integrase [Phocaeicola coprocola]MBV4031895.1 site-specific integrase [Phocaeicola coprocola]MBV4040785.1 site-specific integrase [Phocaeicola coprocola]MBV4060114.1 site-specific integrase [Phocaeicola coprocola]
MDKIKYRLVYNRKKQLNKQGTALVQVEASLNQRKVYFKTNIYLKPEHWDKRTSQVIVHPQANDLNAMLFEFVLHLQGVELALWKRGVPATLSLLKDAMKKNRPVNVTFPVFAKEYVTHSDRRESTKENLYTTITVLQEFRPGLDFKDITYTFLKDFEVYLREKGNGVNTVAKHLRQLRTLVNEAINQGYIHADAYPFRKFKIKQEKGRHEFLTPDELRKLEKIEISDKKLRHVLDAFLFCCYVGLRFSDFCQLKQSNFIKVNGKKWLHFKSVKTGIELRLPLHLLFEGKALYILDRYNIAEFASLGSNSEVNKCLAQISEMARIKKHVTYHTARHTCATLLIHQGVPITTVQKLLGHTSVKTTEIYSEILSNTIVKDLRAIKRKRIVNNFQNYASAR